MDDKAIAALRAELKGLDSHDLVERGKALGLDVIGASSRDDAEEMIEVEIVRRAEAAAREAAPKTPVKSGGNARTGKRAIGNDLDDAAIAAVQKVWAWWSRNISREAQSQGVWELPKDRRRDATDHKVPDGDYRVLGADWILSFRGGRFVQALRATQETRSDSYANVPGQAGKF